MTDPILFVFPVLAMLSALSRAEAEVPAAAALAKGPLAPHPVNPRYFGTPDGRAVYLTGSGTWNSLVEQGTNSRPTDFDYSGFLEFLVRNNHNFTRLWAVEFSKFHDGNEIRYTWPSPWLRTGPGLALDGAPQFDLAQFDERYFDRLRARVEEAGRRGIYVSIMLFEGWVLQHDQLGFIGHPFHPQNNINGINGDPDGDGRGLEIQTLSDSKITALQKRYVRKVVDTVNDLDNVLFEIANETRPEHAAWQRDMLRFLKNYEAMLPKQHPVGMTSFYPHENSNDALWASEADWISPENTETEPFKWNPPASDGKKVVLADTDHLWGIGGTAQWVWKCFLRGINPIFMDPGPDVKGSLEPSSEWNSIRNAMGQTRTFAEKIQLEKFEPRGELASSKYCLAYPGRAYLVLLPASESKIRSLLNNAIGRNESVTLDLRGAAGTFDVEWFSPDLGTTVSGDRQVGGAVCSLVAPFAGDAVLSLSLE